jgi:hypothetical protein
MFSPGGVDSPGSHALLHGCLISLAPTTPPPNSTRPRYGRGIARYLPLTGGSTCCRSPTAAAEMMEVRFDYLVYALGSHLPPCINVWSGPGPMPAQQGSELMRPGRCCREQPPADSRESAESRALPLRRGRASACQALPTPPEAADATETTAQGNASVADIATQLQESLVLDPHLPYDERPPSPPDSRSTSPRQKEASGTPTANLPPCRGSKTEGVAWLRDAQERICKAASVLVIGGGALGVQFAADIAALYGTPSAPKSDTPKQVTLVSSSKKLLPRFDDYLHEETMRRFEALGVDVLLGARADLESMKITSDERRVVRTLDGREAAADLVVSGVQCGSLLHWLTHNCAAVLHGSASEHVLPLHLCLQPRPRLGALRPQPHGARQPASAARRAHARLGRGAAGGAGHGARLCHRRRRGRVWRAQRRPHGLDAG